MVSMSRENQTAEQEVCTSCISSSAQIPGHTWHISGDMVAKKKKQPAHEQQKMQRLQKGRAEEANPDLSSLQRERHRSVHLQGAVARGVKKRTNTSQEFIPPS